METHGALTRILRDNGIDRTFRALALALEELAHEADRDGYGMLAERYHAEALALEDYATGRLE